MTTSAGGNIYAESVPHTVHRADVTGGEDGVRRRS